MIGRLWGERGQALVEFALTFLMFFALVLFLVDGSRILWNQITLNASAVARARYASIHGSESTTPQGPGSYDDVKQCVRDSAFGLEQTDLQIDASWEGGSNDPGHHVTVSLTYPVTPTTSLFWGGSPLQLRASATTKVLH
jgi:hypothetical protein